MADTKHLMSEVAERYGLRMDPEDPALEFITLAHLMLEEALKRAVEEIRSATRNFEKAAERVQSRAGTAVGQHFNNLRARFREEIDEDIQKARKNIAETISKYREVPRRFAIEWIAVGLLSGLMLLVCGVIAGMMFR